MTILGFNADEPTEKWVTVWVGVTECSFKEKLPLLQSMDKDDCVWNLRVWLECLLIFHGPGAEGSGKSGQSDEWSSLSTRLSLKNCIQMRS